MWRLFLSRDTVASFEAAVLTEIYLCNVCSWQEILRRNGRGQKAVGWTPKRSLVCVMETCGG
jgi:hypothetical protein